MRYAIREIESGPYRVSVDRRERTLGRLERAYHLRWALPCAPFVLALFALTIRGRTPAHWWLPALAALGACVAYYLLLVAGQAAGERGLLPPVAAAWLPNVLVVAVCLFTSRREPENSRT
jgi:lipopolysaccharide export LptBFGC system permease protein LptF